MLFQVGRDHKLEIKWGNDDGDEGRNAMRVCVCVYHKTTVCGLVLHFNVFAQFEKISNK